MGLVRPKLRLVSSEPHVQAGPPLPNGALSLDDSELLAAMRAADESAAVAFHNRLRPRVEGTLRRLLGGNDADHDDLVQLAMIALVDAVEDYRGECSLESWASAITAKVAYKHLRRRRLERKLFDGQEPSGDLAGPSSLLRSVTARDLVTRVRRHLDAMAPDKAWAFLLHDVCGFDLREIAGMTETTVAAAQSRLVRGRRELHDRIGADPELAEEFPNDDGEDPEEGGPRE
jgi:RNA polymerase sigma-70 factor (ECF subfamily)